MAAGAAPPNSRTVSAFRFPPSLSTKNEEELRKRAISKEFAPASGIRTAADNELRELNFQASLPCEERSKGLQGICFPYIDLELNAEAAWRIKPDTTFTMSNGSHPKYLSRIGDKPRAFFPHTTTLELLSDPKVNVVITEGEYKTLAIAEALQKAEQKLKFAVIGLQGVNGGWHREKHVVPTANAGHEKKPTGPPHLIDDLQSIEWKKRTVYMCFDSDIASKKHASAFKQSKYAGAWGAEDMAGSGALFGEADSIVSIYKKVRRSDDTRRFKMVFDLRHAETTDPMELFRMGGENSMLWTAEPWTDTPSGQADESLDRILAVLSKDRMARFKARAIEDMVGIKRTALYGKLNSLVRSGQIKKDGNLYYVSD